MPRSWPLPDFGHRVLVAWNGSAQSAAALRKALPLLRRAEQVTVLLGHSRATFPPPCACRRSTSYLRHEGVSAEAKNLDVADADAGKAILKLAEDGKIDLIVMGAFGRSRFREWVLGGATRHVLEDMTVPVFMAHQ